MANRTASDMRAHLASFEPEYPIKKGYVTRLLVNEKLSVSDVGRRIKEIVQMAEPDKHLHEQRTLSAINHLKIIAKKKVCYPVQRQWDGFVRLSQELLGISFHDDTAQAVDSSAITSRAFMQPDYTNTLFTQPEHTSVPMPLQDTSEPSVVAVVGLTSDSVHNNLSFLVRSRSPSPKRLKRDCDNCVNKQRTNLNMLKENKSLRMQIKTLRLHYRKERKQMSLKTLNEKIRRQSQSATLWRSKYVMIMRAYTEMRKVNRLERRTQRKLLKRVAPLEAYVEENNRLKRQATISKRLLKTTEKERDRLRREIDEITQKSEKFTLNIQAIDTKLREGREHISYLENHKNFNNSA